MSTEIGYGFFPGGDPRKFTPDMDMNTKEEIASWKLACAEWDKGNEVQPLHGCILHDGRIVNLSGFGLGTYEFEIDDEDDDFLSPSPSSHQEEATHD